MKGYCSEWSETRVRATVDRDCPICGLPSRPVEAPQSPVPTPDAASAVSGGAEASTATRGARE